MNSLIISSTVHKYLVNKSVRTNTEPAPVKNYYFKLPYIGWFSSQTQRRLCKLSSFYCNNINLVLAISSLQIGSYLNVKNLILMDSGRVLFTNFHVHAVMLIISRRQTDISAYEQKTYFKNR